MPGLIRNTVTSNGSITSDNAPNLAVPAGGAAGRGYLMLITSRQDMVVDAWPDGFVEIGEVPTETGYGLRMRAALRPYDGTEGSTFAATLNIYSFWGAICGVIDGVSSFTVVDSSSVGAYAGFVTNVNLDGGTVTAPAGAHTVFWLGASASPETAPATALTAPGSFTTPTGGAVEIYADYTLHMAYRSGVTPGNYNPVGNHAWADGGARSALGMAFVLAEPGGGDTTAPVLTSPTGTQTGSTTATVGATTDEGNGTLYAVVTTSATQPSVAQIKAGQNNGGTAAAWAGSQAVSSTGAKTLNATGLSASTVYYAHLVHTDASANDSNRVTSASFTTAAPSPDIDSVSDTTPANGSTLTITGTAFGGTQGAKTVQLGGVDQTVTSWADTSIAVTVARGTNKYGAALNVRLREGGSTISNEFALTGLEPQAGWAYVDLGTPNTTASNRITASPDLASGDQLAYEALGGDVVVASDATFAVEEGVTEFDVEVWTPVDGWGSVATQTVSDLTAVGASFAANYAVQAAVGASLAAAYGVQNAVGVSFSAAYTVEGPGPSAVGQSLAVTYGVQGVAGASLAGSYAVQSSVGASFSAAYSVVGLAGRSLFMSYQVGDLVLTGIAQRPCSPASVGGLMTIG